jgi:hypothetical protein
MKTCSVRRPIHRHTRERYVEMYGGPASHTLLGAVKVFFWFCSPHCVVDLIGWMFDFFVFWLSGVQYCGGFLENLTLP